MSILDIQIIPAFSDNYIYLLTCPETKKVAVIDPGSAKPVLDFVDQNNLKIDKILCTHHHPDHIGGNQEVKKRFSSEVIGFVGDKNRIPGIDKTVVEGDIVLVGNAEAHVLETPGHTKGHISYYFPESRAVFCADTVFSGGCGRLFEGTALQMHISCQKIAQLPDETKVFFAHEYTQSNLRFALSVDPGNQDLKNYAKKVEKILEEGSYTTPSTVAQEKKINPFLRCHDESIRQNIGLSDAPAEKIFQALRTQKNNF